MDRVEAQLAVEAGTLSEAVAEISPDGRGWLLEMADEHGHRELLTDTQQKPTVFHHLDDLSREAIELGFRGLRIDEHV